MKIVLNITNNINGWDKIDYVGPINEEAEVHLSTILSKNTVGSKCIINFQQVEFVNSCGVRAWVNFMREFEKNREIIFEKCIPEIVIQINMIPSFKGNAKIKSVFGPYTCPSCGHKQLQLLEDGVDFNTVEKSITLREVKCEKCNTISELDELEDEFFGFLF